MRSQILRSMSSELSVRTENSKLMLPVIFQTKHSLELASNEDDEMKALGKMRAERVKSNEEASEEATAG